MHQSHGHSQGNGASSWFRGSVVIVWAQTCRPTVARAHIFGTRDNDQYSTQQCQLIVDGCLGIQGNLHSPPYYSTPPPKVQNAPEQPNKPRWGRGKGKDTRNRYLVRSSSPGAADFHYYQPRYCWVAFVDPSAYTSPPFLVGGSAQRSYKGTPGVPRRPRRRPQILPYPEFSRPRRDMGEAAARRVAMPPG